ncbi:MAG: hypothetical protein HY584_00975 [Candidatus Omnitrophica bacterium]|nr:hypothetical protein [Candidatus Omnitrophota bacterium]
MSKVLILYVEAGHGHKKVAEAVRDELRSRNVPGLSVDIFDALRKTNWLFRNFYPKAYYFLVIFAPWLWGFFYYVTNLPMIYGLIAPIRTLWNWIQSSNLRAYLEREQFDFILFTHFFPAEVSATAKQKGRLRATLITIVTDVIPHAVWINPGTDSYWVMAEESRQRLLRSGVSEDQIYPNGIPISREFITTNDRPALEKKLGLQPNRLSILFSSGSFGIGPTEQVLDSFRDLRDQIQVLVVCGNNRSLYGSLSGKQFPFPLILFGFVDNMHEIMSVSDLLIAKPGGATTCESLAKKLPMIILEPIPGQESYNAEWLIKRRAAFGMDRPGTIKDLVQEMIQNPELLASAKKAIEEIAKPHAASDLADFIAEHSKK